MATPDKSSVTCAVTVIVCAPPEVLTAFGVKSNPTNCGGVLSLTANHPVMSTMT